MTKEIIIRDIEHIREAACEFLEVFHDSFANTNTVKCFAFYAPMGAGKTTFIKAICEELGSTDVITSPTFAIVNEYTANKFPIYHFDLYRIKKLEELYDIGADDYFYSGYPCFIEWPEMAESTLPDETIKITIDSQNNGSRIVSFSIEQ